MKDPTPKKLIQSIRTALSSGDLSKAQQLSREAFKLYPDREDIKKFADILEPAKATSLKRTIDKGWQKSREWVRQQRLNRNYLNQWVAVRDGELLATGNSIDELVDRVGDRSGVFLTVIY